MVLRFIQNYHTFHPERAVAQDLSRFQHCEEMLPAGREQISIRYRLQSQSTPFVLLSHGNSSSIESIAPTYDLYEELGISYLAYDYPGYGKSSGRPSEVGLYASFQAAYQFVVESLKIPAERLFLHGVSLGGAVTINALPCLNVRGAILESTFTSARDMAKILFPRTPGIGVAARGFDSLSLVGKASCDLLFIHGSDDVTIPASHSQTLLAAATAPAYLYLIPGGGHVNQKEVGAAQYRAMWREFLARGVTGLKAASVD